MKRVILESPLAGDVAENVKYARQCMRDCLLRGEAPFASHLLYAQDGILDDLVHDERELGINAGFEWRSAAELTVFYVDRGWSNGMLRAKDHCDKNNMPFVTRSLYGVARKVQR